MYWPTVVFQPFLMYRSIVLSLFPVRPSRLSSQNRKQSIQSEHCSRMGREGSLPKSNLTETDSSVAFETRAVKVTVNLSVAICLIWWDHIKFDWSFHYFIQRVHNVWPETWHFQHSWNARKKIIWEHTKKATIDLPCLRNAINCVFSCIGIKVTI